MNIKTNLFEDPLSFVDTTKKQNKYFKSVTFFVVTLSLFLFFLLYKYINE